MVTALDTIGTDQALQEHWIKRIVALILDALIVSIPAWILSFFMISFHGWVFYSFFSSVIFFLYCIILELSMDSTIGKKILNMQVIPLSGTLDISKVLLRNISKLYWLALLLDWLLGFVTEGDPKQKYMDRIAGTTVITTDMPTQQQQHIYQTDQYQYAPPSQEHYPQQTSPTYQYQTPPPQQLEQQPQHPEETCKSCEGRLILTGDGRYQCIRCGRIY